MSAYVAKVKEMKSKTQGYWARRVLNELEFAYRLSSYRGGKFDAALDAACGYLYANSATEGYVTKEVALAAEEMMAPIGPEAKKYTLNCVGHAHIDMNWQWRYDETVSITLDTFRTMLDLMKDYPEFVFAQSQASVYEIVEKYHPDMLAEIKQRVHEGRWELTAASWVEPDKNMPSGESFARHILYTKRYLSKLFDIDPDRLNMDFIPDTFGHCVNLPEILASGGVKYYYYGRCAVGHNIFKWQSPSGTQIIVYREPYGYNSEINPEIILNMPDYLEKHGMTMMNRVCGMGDHGGGPSRRDIEYLLDMNKWPICPNVQFGTYATFLKELEKIADRLPVVDEELNFVFTGCYTTQTRIKMANRRSEAKLNEAEAAGAFAAQAVGYRYNRAGYEDAWRKTLFAHFHDILPGSGVQETREHALGQFQNVLAVANTEESESLRAVAANIDTWEWRNEERRDLLNAMSEGAGVGYEVLEFKMPTKEIGLGINRVYHIFNPSPRERTEVVDINLWDWEGNPERLLIKDAKGAKIEHMLVPKTFAYRWNNRYWGHDFAKVWIRVTVPACGYASFLLTEAPEAKFASLLPNNDKEHKEFTYVMENEQVRVVFNHMNFGIVSIIDKETGEDLVRGNGDRMAGFRFIEENGRGMSSWNVGRYMNVSSLHDGGQVKWIEHNLNPNALRQYIKYEMAFRESKLTVIVSLAKDSARLDFDTEVDWFQKGTRETLVPQLNFFVPLSYKTDRYKYEIANGTIIRPSVDHDMPSTGWALGMREEPEEQKSLMLMAETRYGFRGYDDGLGLDLIRSSFDPDPYPEIGVHRIRFAVQVVNDTDNGYLMEQSYHFCHPLVPWHGKARKGTMPKDLSFMTLLEGSVMVAAIKNAEDSDLLIVRLAETNGQKSIVRLRFFKPIETAAFTDINETGPGKEGAKRKIKVSNDTVTYEAVPYGVTTIAVKFR